jgi:hypothetical protein
VLGLPVLLGACGSVVVKALRYETGGRWFETDDVNEIFNLLNPSGRTRSLGLLGLEQKRGLEAQK